MVTLKFLKPSPTWRTRWSFFLFPLLIAVNELFKPIYYLYKQLSTTLKITHTFTTIFDSDPTFSISLQPSLFRYSWILYVENPKKNAQAKEVVVEMKVVQKISQIRFLKPKCHIVLNTTISNPIFSISYATCV